MRYWGFVLPFLLLSVSVNAETCPDWVAKAISIQGTVELRETNTTSGNRWTKVQRGHTFCANDIVRVKNNSRAAVILTNDTILRLDQNSTITFANISASSASTINLTKGIAHFISRVKQAFEVVTPFVNAAVEGTEFVVSVYQAQSQVTVFEGLVRVSNQQGEVLLAQNQTASALKGQAPVLKTVIKPRDAVQWALYYPVIVNENAVSASLKKEILSAAKLLASGRVEQAKESINKVLASAPKQAEALALKAIISLVNNDKDQALTLATQAIESDSQNISALLAMSYVQQAHFDIQAALNTLTNKPSSNALMHTRLSELYLMTGQLDDALAQAKQAVELDSQLSKTQSVLGFAYLTQIEVKQAEEAFNKAIELDQTEPLARLGLGLALIRQGKLEEGRREIEYAASLDPNNALIRSYLGKAYYEEKRDKVAASQFDMAKELDPNDPTAWFYSAIQKQSTNRPVEALQDLQTSTELNDNRAVYRSQLLLDQDNAARSAGLARIYRDLGFDQLAQQEAFNSINEDFSNHSAHRFLAESYAGRPRHEIGRVSELLQSQVLAPVSATPVAPHLSETDLGVQPNAGPGGASFNEYDSLFSRDQSRFQVTALAGNNATSGDELVYSELVGDTSLSLGQYNFRTDGFRANNDFKQDIYNMFMHTAISPSQSIQFEFKKSEKENGDLRLRFDPTIFSQVRRETRDEDTYRVGYHNKINQNSDFIASIIQRDTLFTRDESVEVSPVGPFGPLIGVDIRSENSSAHTAELQYIAKDENYDLIVGGGYYNNRRKDNTTVQLTSGGIVLNGAPTNSAFNRKTSNAYIYSNWKVLNNIIITTGISYNDLDDPSFTDDQVNPKLGLRWNISSNTRLQTAAFRTLTRPLTGSQTIEPTQIAGFNQFYSEPAGSDADNYGISIEHSFKNNLQTGIELTKRNINIPSNSGIGVLYEDQSEYMHRMYFYWSPNSVLSISAVYEYENISRVITANSILAVPQDLNTHKLPLGIKMQFSNSWSAELTATYYDQKVVQPLTATTSRTDEDDFWITDARIGYRFPKRLGIINLEFRNLFDEEFNYYDATFRTGVAQPATIYHEQSVWLRFVLNFD